MHPCIHQDWSLAMTDATLTSKERFITTGFRRRRSGGFWHLLVALHKRWRVDYVRPPGKPNYRRLYIGPVEIEWSMS